MKDYLHGNYIGTINDNFKHKNSDIYHIFFQFIFGEENVGGMIKDVTEQDVKSILKRKIYDSAINSIMITTEDDEGTTYLNIAFTKFSDSKDPTFGGFMNTIFNFYIDRQGKVFSRYFK
jgi:hypothetical protein